MVLKNIAIRISSTSYIVVCLITPRLVFMRRKDAMLARKEAP